ncbi:3-hydroxy-9,10-secoandrosta-1,3,5(10)-triene-9,17-dione monooxygenase oxygenase subunit [Streptomyces sp. NPDC001657]|uniref:3-hydroxy-9,10-secoandrosta-1,3,5(10)-triene-9, 17-dione monooxygenase oxygenase subunit n=1 Tax=Streptomyces sp. NPDC001657 TaxID=3154522 RepID=UPI00332F54F6
MRDDRVLAAVRDLAPALRERAAEAEALRRVPASSVEELARAGFFRLLQPSAYGGFAADPAVFHAAVKEIAKACGATGWGAAVLGVHPWHMALFDPRAQEEVWGEDRSARICSSYAPTGTVTPVDGGFRLSGRWRFSSGCDHAQWALLSGLVADAEGRPVDMRTFLVPRSEYRIDDVWDAVGLRGTGSNDLVIEDVFVPEHRTLGYGPMSALTCPGHRRNPEPLYRLPYAVVFTTTISTAIVGIAEGAYEDHVATARRRSQVSPGQRVAEDPFAQVRLARAASDIDAAWLQLTRNMGEMYALARSGAELPMELRIRTRRDQVRATERAVAAVDLLMENAGGSALRNGPNPVQRAWRDAHTGRGHAANDPERALVMYGQCALGIDTQDTMA